MEFDYRDEQQTALPTNSKDYQKVQEEINYWDLMLQDQDQHQQSQDPLNNIVIKTGVKTMMTQLQLSKSPRKSNQKTSQAKDKNL